MDAIRWHPCRLVHQGLRLNRCGAVSVTDAPAVEIPSHRAVPAELSGSGLFGQKDTSSG